MYLLYAPKEKFGNLPPKTALLTDEVLFTGNVAHCPKFYWKKFHTLQGCIDISPRWMKNMRKKRELQKILIIAQGGIGDVAWTMPVAKALWKKHPRANIVVATEERTAPLYLHVPYVRACVSSDFWNMQNLIRTCDEVYDFGGIATVLKKEMKKEPVEACFFHIDIERPKQKKDMRPHLVLSIDEGKQAEAMLKKCGVDTRNDIIVTIGTESSTPNRNWPMEYNTILSQKLTAQGIKVIWLSENPEIRGRKTYFCKCGEEWTLASEKMPEKIVWTCHGCKKENTIENNTPDVGILNLAGKTSLRQSMAILAMSNLYIGPNSGLMVLSTALETPTIGLFGAFSPNRIGKYYEKFSYLWGKPKCAPCNEHWTECEGGYPAPCMKLITPELVFKRAMYMLTKYPRKKIETMPIE